MKETRRTLSASSLSGDKVVDTRGEKIGKIEDIMIDVVDGKVAYAVLSFGGFLGLGDKLFALPWSALEVDEVNKNIVVDVSKEFLENAPGFDKDNWPDFSADEYRQSVDTYYRAPH
jgi:sporulation protein YlmC with PRC-barrel domain